MSFSFLNATLALAPLSSSNSSLHPLLVSCLGLTSASFVFSSFTGTFTLLLLPLFMLVLYVGVQRWRHHHSARGGRAVNHSDVITYHLVSLEVVTILGLLFYSYGIATQSTTIELLGTYIFCFIFPGQSFFHCLICVEHYLAVVSPVSYLRLRERGGVRIRNIGIGCVWLLCFGLMAANTFYPNSFPTTLFLCLLGFSILTELFCSLSVLHVLIRPGPGEAGRDRDGADQSKHRAFYIITAILCVQLLRFFGFFISVVLSYWFFLSERVCVLLISGIWLTLPSSLVQPLLFLHRAGKFACCRWHSG